jgi:hypothetical protein
VSSKTDIFKEKASLIHLDFYTYTESMYVNSKVPLIVTCPVHGDFKVTPNDHLSKKSGCKDCSLAKRTGRKPTFTYEDRVTQLSSKFGTQLSYTMLSSDKVQISCKFHRNY